MNEPAWSEGQESAQHDKTGFRRVARSAGRRVADRMATQAPLVRRTANVHRMTLIASAGTLFLVFVPQIAVLFRWPGEPSEWAALTASMLIALTLQVIGWLCVLPTREIHAIDPALLGSEHGLLARLHRKLEPLGACFDRVFAYFTDKPRRSLALLLAVLAFSIAWSEMTPLAVYAVLACVWIASRRFSDRMLGYIGAPAVARPAASKLIGRAVLVILTTSMLLELLWALQEGLLGGLPYRVYSTWAMLQTLFAIALMVRVIDVLGLLSLPWIRVWPAVMLVLVLACIPGGERVGIAKTASGLVPIAKAAPGTAAHDGAWFEQLVARLDELPRDQPAILIAASGGGSRAAITAALVYEQLARMPAADGRRSLADNVLLVSSVSGGSLATGYFITHGTTAKGAAEAGAVELDPRRNAFVREMSSDFMAPLLRGVLNMRQERGSAVASFWRNRYGWRSVTDSARRPEGRPLAVFNSTHVQTGARVGFGIPALPPKLLAPSFVAADLDANLEIDLAEAVRMSANFPYGFEHAVLGPDLRGMAPEIIDGGVVDNTGLDTLVLLLENVQAETTAPIAEAATLEDPARRRRALAQQARAGLLQRGMLVLEIDAGARPSEPSWLSSRFPSLSKPLEALGRAGHQNSGALRTQYLNRLREAFPQSGKSALVGVVRAGFDCNASGDVITAWALDHRAREQIYREYARTQKRLDRTLKLQYAAIRELQRTGPAADAASALHELESNDLRAIYDDYIDRTMATDAEQHESAPGCKPPSDANAPGAAEHALAEALKRKGFASGQVVMISEPPGEPAPPPQVDPPGDLPFHSTKSPRPAAGDGGTASEPVKEEKPASASLGWVYVGQRDGERWQTKYMRWTGGDLPKRGEIVRLVSSSNVRTNIPDDEGRLAPAHLVLPANAELRVLETKTWGGTHFVWARVAVPQDMEAQRAIQSAK